MRNLKRALSLGLTATMISGPMVMGSSAASYADVTSKQNEEAIEVLKTVGIMVGDENGKFNPEAKVTRNEMAVVMCNLLDYTVASYKGTSPFTDVPEWAEPYVAACYTNGITSGYDAKTYGGSDTVTTGQAALMLLKALGYFQYSADFGSDWLVETTKNGSTAGLFDGVATGAKEALTRNDVAQMVLNALEADLVKAEKNGSDVQVGDIVISGGKATYDSRTGTDSKYAKIDSTKVDGKYTIQLGEDLYDGDLVKADGADDDFGRPSVKWTYENKEIGTYADDADAVYTATVEKQDLYDLVGSDVYNDLKNGDADFNVVKDGVAQDVKLSDYIVKNNDDDAGKDVIKKGATTEVFIDDDSNDVVIAVINSYVAQVDGDYDKNDEELELDILDEAPVDVKDTTLSSDDFDYLDSYSDEDYVLITVANKEIKTIALAETVEGKVTAYTEKKNVTVDGTKYEYSKNYTKAVDEEMKYDLNEAYTVVLDANGYVAYIDESAVTYDYAYVLSMGTDDDQYGKGDNKGTTVYARLVLTDGTMVKVETDVKNGDTSLNNHLVSYTVDKNDVYSLSDRSSAKISTDTDLKIENGVAGMNISFNSKERYKRAPPDFGPGCSFYLSNGKVDIVGIQAVHLTGVAVSIPGDPVARPCDSVLCVHDVAVRQMVVAVGHTWDQEETAVVAVLRADRDKLRGTPQGGRKIQGAGMGLSTGPIPGVRPDHQLRHRRPDGLQRRRGSLFRHLRGQSVQGRLVGFFRLRGGQILESAVNLGVVLVEIGAEYLIVRLPLIE